MRNKWFIYFALILAGCSGGSSSNFSAESGFSFNTDNFIQYVDPFIGTGFHGHTFPGPSLPRGMVQLSPDTRLNGWDASSGYHYSDSTIYGFSHTHLSGTGIGDMGDVLLLPFTGAAEKILHTRENLPVATFRHEREEASPGYYKVEFDNYQVEAELTATSRVGMHRYQFGSYDDKMLLLDIGHILQRTWGHENVLNSLEVVDSYTLRGLKHSTGWSHDHQAYFHMEFSSPFSIQQVNIDGENRAAAESYRGQDIWSILHFRELADDEPLLVKVAISPVDTEGASKNMEAEIPQWNFEQLRSAAETAWNDALGKIRISAIEEEQYTIFYTSLYHAMMAPTLYQDVDGRYRGMDGEIHQADPGNINYTAYSLWDTFRALHPLMTLIDKDITMEWANNLLLKYQQGGILPKWPLAASYTGTMIAYPAVAFLTDVVTKEMEGIDPEEVLDASLISATWIDDLPDPRENPRMEKMMPRHNYYVNLYQHIPADQVSGSVSYGLEMAYYDWCIARLAAFCGKDSIEAEFLERSRYYSRYFDASSGFMRGKNSDGSWITPFNPRFSDHEDSPYVEGNAWQWSWFVPHDPEGLMELYGGAAGFEEKLDSLFSTSSVIEGENASGDITGLIGQYAHGNEPSHHIAYFYIPAGAPWKTQELVDSILHAFYSDQPDGIIGNEDCGQMSAWYILNAMGIYQVTPGNPIWTIGCPLFHRAEIEVGPERLFTIETRNNKSENRYIQGIKLNGVEKKDFFLHHKEIIQGGILEITMGSELSFSP
jgi:predicted alpha-1,2-mannosidase